MTINDFLEVDDALGGIHLVDPDLTRHDFAPGAALPEPPIGPTRATVWVPTDRTTVNLGQDIRSPSVPEATVVDRGIAGRTDHHVHFLTSAPEHDKNADKERTLARLGAHPLSIMVDDATAGYDPNHLGIPSVVPRAHNAWSGYAMVTGGAAVHESRFNHILVSGDAEARVAGKTAVQIGSPGNVFITADSGIRLDRFARNWGVDPGEDGPGMGADRDSTEGVVSDVISVFSTALSQIYTVEEAFLQQYSRAPYGASSLTAPPSDAKAAWLAADIGDIVGSVAKQAVIGLGIKALVDHEESPGRVALFGSDSVKAYGGSTAAVHSAIFTSVGSDTAAVVSANVAAALSSLLVASVSGTFTSVGGTLSATLSSQLGSARVVGRKYVAVTSDEGRAFVTSGGNAQLNSTDHSVFVHGKGGVYIGAGGGARRPRAPVAFTPIEYDPTGEGFAIRMQNDGMTIGLVHSPNNFSAPDPDPKRLIFITADALSLRHGNAAVTLANGDLQLQAHGRVLLDTTVSPPAPPPLAAPWA